MEFNPHNSIVRLCMQGIRMEETGREDEAAAQFLDAWNQGTNNFEKFIAAYYIARQQKNPSEKLSWYETTLHFALQIDDDAVKSAYPSLYSNIAQCYEELDDADNAQKHHQLALMSVKEPSDKGPFFHGTRADLSIGDLLIPRRISNYQPDLMMNHIYFTALINGAGLAAALALGAGTERIYIVEPTGSFEDDPNVTNKKFPGNPTRSYRSNYPLKIIGEVNDWERQTPEQLQQWRDKVASGKGEIIN